MQIIGDLERFVAQSLYPLRVPIAVLAFVGVVISDGSAAVVRCYRMLGTWPGRNASI